MHVLQTKDFIHPFNWEAWDAFDCLLDMEDESGDIPSLNSFMQHMIFYFVCMVVEMVVTGELDPDEVSVWDIDEEWLEEAMEDEERLDQIRIHLQTTYEHNAIFPVALHHVLHHEQPAFFEMKYILAVIDWLKEDNVFMDVHGYQGLTYINPPLQEVW